MNLTVHGMVFVGLLLAYQTTLIFWSHRRGAGVGLLLLVAVVPFIGLPALLYRQRSRIQDNHIAGALTYLTLVVAVFAFLLWYPKHMDDDIPWALIHTMEFFAFLGLANLVMSPFKD